MPDLDYAAPDSFGMFLVGMALIIPAVVLMMNIVVQIMQDDGTLSYCADFADLPIPPPPVRETAVPPKHVGAHRLRKSAPDETIIALSRARVGE